MTPQDPRVRLHDVTLQHTGPAGEHLLDHLAQALGEALAPAPGVSQAVGTRVAGTDRDTLAALVEDAVRRALRQPDR